jgi:hypothetical protein
MIDRLEILNFFEDAAVQMARLARKEGIPPHIAEELTQIALELGVEAVQLQAELQLDNLSARVANTNRRGIMGLSD